MCRMKSPAACLALLTLAACIVVAASPAPAPHPRLLFDAAGLEQIRAAAATPELAPIKGRLMERASRLLTAPPLLVSTTKRGEPDPPGQLKGLEASRRLQGRVFTYAMAFLLSGEKRYRDAAVAELEHALEQWPIWVDTAHQPPFDLMTGENCLTYAVAYDWLHDALTPAERARLRQGVERRALEGYLDATTRAKPMFWFTATMNWNPVTNGGATMLALALGDDSELSERVLKLAPQGMSHYWNELEDDGAWKEGTGYWTYGHRYAFMAADALRRAGRPEGEQYLSRPGARATGYFPIVFNPGRTLSASFGDSPSRANDPLFYFLAREYQNPDFAWFQDRNVPRGLDREGWPDEALALIWKAGGTPAPHAPSPGGTPAPHAPSPGGTPAPHAPSPGGTPAPHAPSSGGTPAPHAPSPGGTPAPHAPSPGGTPAPRGAIPAVKAFSSIGWAMITPRQPDPPFFLAFKNGSLAANHTHLDLNHVSVGVGDAMVLVDLGNRSYPADYFDPVKRPTYYEISTAGHNAVLVGGQGQVTGRPGKLLGPFEGPRYAAFTGVADKAYQVDVPRARRHVVFVDSKYFVLLDEIEPAAPAAVELRFHSYGQFLPGAGGRWTVIQDKGAVDVVPALDGASGKPIVVGAVEAAVGWTRPVKVLRLRAGADAPRFVVATAVFPADGKSTATTPRVLQSLRGEELVVEVGPDRLTWRRGVEGYEFKGVSPPATNR
jgi:hypothetical protein